MGLSFLLSVVLILCPCSHSWIGVDSVEPVGLTTSLAFGGDLQDGTVQLVQKADDFLAAVEYFSVIVNSSVTSSPKYGVSMDSNKQRLDVLVMELHKATQSIRRALALLPAHQKQHEGKTHSSPSSVKQDVTAVESNALRLTDRRDLDGKQEVSAAANCCEESPVALDSPCVCCGSPYEVCHSTNLDEGDGDCEGNDDLCR